MLHVVEVNDIEELANYRLLWNSLLPQTRNATFFQSFDWLDTYWRHFGDDQILRVLIVYRDREPIGILPLVVRSESTLVGSVRVLTYPLHDWGTFYGPIGPNATATLRIGLRHIRDTSRNWDILDLRWIDSDGCDFGRTKHAMKASDFHPNKQAWSETAGIDMSGSWEDYWRSRSTKWRGNVRRCERRLAEQGKVTFVRHRPDSAANGDGDPRWDLYEDCLEVARRSWQGSSTTGTTLSHESIQPFLRDVHAAASRNGAIDICLLYVDDKPVAFMYNYHYNGSIYGLRMGFDQEFAQLSPGLVLTKAVFKDCFARNDPYYDFGVGSMHAKRNWLNMTAISYRYTHFPITAAKAQVLRIKRWYVQRVHGKEYPTGCSDRIRLGA